MTASPKPRKAAPARRAPAKRRVEPAAPMPKPIAPVAPPPASTAAAPAPQPDRDQAWRDLMDRAAHAALARVTLGLSPASLGLAWADWATHLAGSPGTQASLAASATRLQADWLRYVGELAAHGFKSDGKGPVGATPAKVDNRFSAPQWQQFPFNLLYQSFLLRQQWLDGAMRGMKGVSPHHEQVMAFLARQWMDMVSPSNFFWSNPEVLEHTLTSGGVSLLSGLNNWQDDLQRMAAGEPPAGTEDFQPGKAVARTPGKVVLRNRLIELIQYAPSTPKVHAEPVLIVPAWIMKYYILDLSAHNSLVQYLVDQGHTVFMLSWANPGPEDRDLGMDDYLQLGIFDALDAVSRIVPDRKVHATGYCLGGTLLSIAAAALAGRHDERLASVTLFAAQTDFTEAGELTLFTDESQVSFLEDLMWSQGYLDSTQMAGTFQMLRSSDLIWSRIMHEYLMGQRPPMSDLMAWNADATRMPYRMHSEYLRSLYLRNALAEGHYQVDGRPVAVENVSVPWFVVGTETDHVAPWTSVYKINLLADSPVTFVLTSGGHNAGIVSEPGHPHRHFRWAEHDPRTPYIAAAEWREQAAQEDGSWWPRWHDWLVAHGSGEQTAPPRMGLPGQAPLCDAPGSYVLQR